MSSGVAVADEVQKKYEELKLGKKLKYVLFKLSDDLKSVVVEKFGNEADYQTFTSQLPPNEPRYAVYDFEYKFTEAEGIRNKILFVLWAPDTAPTKQKMLYTSSKDAIRKKLVGIGVEVQATDLSEIDHATVLDKVKAITK